jgi:TRAP-type C4-dicarboxylate transport system permease small subunit
MKTINRLDQALGGIERSLTAALLFLMVALSFLQILLRNLFSTGIPTTDIVLRHLTLALAFLGASMATREGRHLKIDILPRVMPKWLKKISLVVVNLVALCVCLILAKAGWNFAMLERLSDTPFIFFVPLWFVKLIIPLGFLMVGFRFILRTIQELSGNTSEKEGSSEAEQVVPESEQIASVTEKEQPE